MSQRQRRRKGRRRSRSALTSVALGATLAGGALTAPAAGADPYTVTNTADSGDGSLRQEIADANAHPGGDQILFAPTVTGQITLASQLPQITDALDIHGPGAGVLSVSGNTAHRILSVYLSAPGSVRVSGLTLTGGNAGVERGGAILQYSGDLTVASSVISGSQAARGGAIYFHPPDTIDSSLTVESSTISGNTATSADGGGILMATDIQGETVHGTLTVRNSTVSGNHAPSASAGGVGVEGTADDFYSIVGHLTLEATVTGSTIAGNDASGGTTGGVLAKAGQGGSSTASVQVHLLDTIVADNTKFLGSPGDVEKEGTATADISADFSLIEADDAGVTQPTPGSNIFGQDPQLGVLLDNGGPTPTQSLPQSSPAVDKGKSFGLDADQRGSGRPVDLANVPNSTAAGGDGSDIGAFELLPPPVPPAKCRGVTATKQGTSARDVIQGTPRRDVIAGLGGNDVIRGLGGNDLICGGKGKDKLIGGLGKDKLLGQAGLDRLLGGPGKDLLLGGAGKDKLLGGPGTDKLVGGPGKDVQKQ